MDGAVMSLAVNPYHPEEDEEPQCKKCGSYDVEWETCWSCGGEGGFDLYDEDPVNFAEGEEIETCEECGGNCGYLVCRACQAAAAKK